MTVWVRCSGAVPAEVMNDIPEVREFLESVPIEAKMTKGEYPIPDSLLEKGWLWANYDETGVDGLVNDDFPGNKFLVEADRELPVVKISEAGGFQLWLQKTGPGEQDEKAAICRVGENPEFYDYRVSALLTEWENFSGEKLTVYDLMWV